MLPLKWVLLMLVALQLVLTMVANALPIDIVHTVLHGFAKTKNRPNKSGPMPVLGNMFRPTMVFKVTPEYAARIYTTEGEQGHLLRTMKGIDEMILQTGNQPKWDDFPKAPPYLCDVLPNYQTNMTYDIWFNQVLKVRTLHSEPIAHPSPVAHTFKLSKVG